MRGGPENVLDESETSLRVGTEEKEITRTTIQVVTIDQNGDTTIDSQPQPDIVTQVQRVRSLTTRAEIIDHYVSQTTDEKKAAFRNRVIDHYLGEMDRHYDRFSKRLFTDGIQFALGFDTAIIGLSSAAALFESSADDLATVIAGFAGTQAAINKNLFFDRTVPALVVTMDAQRQKVETEILTNKALGVDRYSLEAAIRDLRRYQEAGTLLRAVTKVTETASNSKEQAEREYEEKLGVACAPNEELSEDDLIAISDVVFDNYNAAVAGDSQAGIRLRAIALAFGVNNQDNIDDVFLRITDAYSSKYCTVEEVGQLKAKLSPFM